MNINRNNYEEYFLLFADNELSQQERNMVEVFVRENTDLEEEFLMLQQSVVKPDASIKIADKDFLLKDERFISLKNYEEVFVLYNDNELSNEEREEVERFISKNPKLKSELELLQKTKLVSDALIFPYKKSLYKKEKRVIPIYWWRMAAAAVLAGAGLWGGVTYLQNSSKEKVGVAIKINQSTPIKTVSIPAKKDNQLPKPAEQNLVVNSSSQKENKKALKEIVITKQDRVKDKTVTQNSFVKNIQQQSSSQKTIEKNIEQLPEQKNEDITVKEVQKKPGEIITPEKNINKPKDVDIANTDNFSNAPAANFAQNASYASEPKNDNYVFYNVSEEKFKNSKLFGFLKKVSRVVERKSPFNHNNKEVAAN